MDDEDQKSLFSRAGLYYELHNQTKEALNCYEKADDRRKISALLLKTAEQHVGIGQYFDIEHYYFSIPKEEILRSPTLMAAMSLLCAMFADFSQSEYWYQTLQDFASHTKISDARYQDAQIRYIYLDITLPQRGNKGLYNLITNVFKIAPEKQMNLPPLSLTSNRPSVLNGSKDFSAWTKQDTLLCEFVMLWVSN